MSAIFSGILFLVQRQIPSTTGLKISLIFYLLFHALFTYGDFVGTGIPYDWILEGGAALISAGLLAATMQTPKKPVLYSSLSFSSFLLLIGAKEIFGQFDYYPGSIYLLITIAGIATSIMIWRDL